MKNTEKSAEQWQEIVSEKDKEIAELRKQVDWFKGQFKRLGTTVPTSFAAPNNSGRPAKRA